MSINASYLVSLTPRVLSGGSADLETNGMVLTSTYLVPTSAPAMSFTSAKAVADVFGAASPEAKFAQQYFTGLTNQAQAPKALIVGLNMQTEMAAWIQSASITATLSELKAVSDGALTINIDGSPVTATGIDLSEAQSLSEVATTVAAKLTGTTGAYNSDLNAFIFTTSKTGATASVGYATSGTGGTDLSSMLGLTQAAGAVLSPGVAAMTPAQNLDAIVAVTANWSQFTTLAEVTEKETAEAYAAWADVSNDYVYIFWSTDSKMTRQTTQSSTIAATLQNTYNCTVMLYTESNDAAAAALAYPATIKWDQEQGMKVLFGKSATGIAASVTDETVAATLDALRVSYVGQFATRNAEFSFFNRGETASSMYGFYDTLIGMIWLRAKIQRACMDGFSTVSRVPYNAKGYTLIKAWISDPIRAAKTVGVIDTGLALSDSQKAQITQEVGQDISNELFTNGYYLQVDDPEANVRAQRGSPVMSLYITYAGSVQKIAMPVTATI